MTFKHDSNRVGVALLVLRITVFLVILIWTIDKFVEPHHASKIMEHFYFIKGVGSSMIYVIGAIELGVLGAFVVGVGASQRVQRAVLYFGNSSRIGLLH